MCADVLVQDGLLAEMFAALAARIWLLTGMDAQVLVEDGALPERARAVHARVRLLVRVDAQVLRQVRLLPESLAALRTPVRSRICMDTLVLQQRGLLFEVFPTCQAFEQPQLRIRIMFSRFRWFRLNYVGQMAQFCRSVLI